MPAFNPCLEAKRRVSCAAIKCDDGTVVTGARHYSPDMRRLMERIYGEGYWKHEAEQGFVDNRGDFLTREQAFVLARESGQCPHLPADGVACLFSEDLY
jgi:hypothetical protein